MGAGSIGCVSGTIGCAESADSCTGGTGSTTGGLTGVVEVWVVLHLPCLIILQNM